MSSSSYITPSKRDAILTCDGRACVYCGRAVRVLRGKSHSNQATLDHCVGRSLGGSHAATNLLTACRRCNTLKGEMDAAAWFAHLTVLTGEPVAAIRARVATHLASHAMLEGHRPAVAGPALAAALATL